MANSNWLEGKWDEFKGEARKLWGHLTDDELEQTKGNLTSIGGIVQQKYGKAEEGIQDRVNELAKKFGHGVTEATETVKEGLRSKKDESH